MARLLALEWDDREARAVVASVRGESAVIEDAFAIALPPAGEHGNGKQGTGEQDRGKVIGAALSAQARRAGANLDWGGPRQHRTEAAFVAAFA